ncbi:MAG TPA: energy transducer TonB [Burkholderiaceae bacterium]|nr:energy transducer TonB [Burkholderiaceae bacterium]
MKTAPARALRHRWHAPERGTGPAFLISLGAHTLLFIAIAFVIRWKTEPAGPVSAELWSGLPPVAEPAPPPPPPPPPVRVERAPEPEPVKPDIVLEQKKPEPKPEKKVEPVKKAEPAKKVEPDTKAEQRKRDEEARERKAAEAAVEKQRQAALARMTADAGTGPAAAAGSPGMPRGYDSQVAGCIKQWISFPVQEGMQKGQYVAEFEVQLAPDGQQLGAPRRVHPSGLAQYDEAVERAIRRCDPFPRPRDGAMPRSLRLTFDPVETR